MTTWHVGGGRSLTLDVPRVMGILNVTPDSFSDGGQHADVDSAVRAGRIMIDEGADIIDVGGESTRPGAEAVDPAEQIRRTRDVIAQLAAHDVLLSIDTTSRDVAAAALDAGAHIINDVSAGLDDPAILTLASERGCGLVLMHRRLKPRDDSYSDAYDAEPTSDDIVRDVRAALETQVQAARAAGIADEAIVIDPGLGFGKSVAQNYALMARLPDLATMGHPVLCGSSRKSFIGAVTGATDPRDRLPGSLAATVLQHQGGCRLFRVHDVAAHRAVLAVAAATPTGGSVDPSNKGVTIARPQASKPGRTPFGDHDMATDLVLEFTDANFDAEVIQSDQPVLVDFWAEWCQPCKMLIPVIDELASDFAGKVKVGKVDTDANQQISMQLGITAIPTVIIFKNGEVQKKLVGLHSKDQFAAAINELG